MDMDDLPVHGEWAIGSAAAMAIKCLLWLSFLGAILLIAWAVRARPRRRR